MLGIAWAVTRRSISDSSGAAFGVHAERLKARRCVFVYALPQRQHQRLNALPMVEFSFPIFVESGSIAVSFGHALILADVRNRTVPFGTCCRSRIHYCVTWLRSPRGTISTNIAWVILRGRFVGILGKRPAWVDGPDAQRHLDSVSHPSLVDHRLPEVSQPQK